jgi:hypothetical protein
MKKYLIIFLTLCLGLTGCDKGLDDSVFDETPDQRLTKTLEGLQTQLSGAPNGWKVFVYPGGGRAYGYYMKFNNENRVTMYGDFNGAQGETAKESSYRLKALQQPSLIFDTYSYIHIPADPKASVNGGDAGQGLNSDFEFAYDPSKAQEDTIRMIGRFKESKLLMIKATADEAAKYGAAKIKAVQDSTRKYLQQNSYLLLRLPDGINKALSMNLTSRAFSLSYVDNGNLVSFNTSFAFTSYGIYLKEPIVYNDKSYYELFWDEAAMVYYLTIDGTRINVQNSPIPIIPIYLKINSDFDIFSIPPPTGGPGSSEEFLTVYQKSKADLFASPYRLNLQWVDFVFTAVNKTFILQTYYTQNTTLFRGDYNYTYTMTPDGIFKFNYVSDANGNATLSAPYMAPLLDYFKTDHFQMEYYNDNGDIYGMFRSIEHPGFYFTGNLE